MCTARSRTLVWPTGGLCGEAGLFQPQASPSSLDADPLWGNGSPLGFGPSSPGSSPGSGADVSLAGRGGVLRPPVGGYPAGERRQPAASPRSAPGVSPARPAAVVVLAAGEGTRMKSSIPKVLHQVGGRAPRAPRRRGRRALEPEHLVVVVGHGRDQVTAHLPRSRPSASHRRPGPAARHRPRRATARSKPCRRSTGTVVVTYGDVPLLTADTLARPARRARGHGNAVTVLTAVLADPTGYGRIIRDADGAVDAHRRAEGRHRASSARSARSTPASTPSTPPCCATRLGRLDTDNAQGEHYLTDVVGIARAAGGRVGASPSPTPWQVEGVNDRVQLAAPAARAQPPHRRALDARGRDGHRSRDHLDRRRRRPRARHHLAARHPAARRAPPWRAARSIGPDSQLVDTAVGEGAR